MREGCLPQGRRLPESLNPRHDDGDLSYRPTSSFPASPAHELPLRSDVKQSTDDFLVAFIVARSTPGNDRRCVWRRRRRWRGRGRRGRERERGRERLWPGRAIKVFVHERVEREEPRGKKSVQEGKVDGARWRRGVGGGKEEGNPWRSGVRNDAATQRRTSVNDGQIRLRSLEHLQLVARHVRITTRHATRVSLALPRPLSLSFSLVVFPSVKGNIHSLIGQSRTVSLAASA